MQISLIWEVLETRPDRDIRSYVPYSFKEERVFFNPLTTMCDQDRISPYNINIKKTSGENKEKY